MVALLAAALAAGPGLSGGKIEKRGGESEGARKESGDRPLQPLSLSSPALSVPRFGAAVVGALQAFTHALTHTHAHTHTHTHTLPLFSATRPAAAPLARRALREVATAAAGPASVSTTFRPPFDWGVATAAYQIEGAARAGGRSPSIWDTFSNDAAAVGDDFYTRYPEDIELMKAMGVTKFRMSLSWPRIIPGAVGEPSAEGIAFYHAVLDALIEAGIEPWVTTYHWDLPQSLQDKFGGWASPDVVPAYEAYAALVFKEYGGKVKNWSTFNEPRTFCTLGYGVGVHAPGIKSVEQTWQCVHHVLEGHAAAAKHFRKTVPDGKLSMNLDGEWGEPLTDSDADKEAAQIHRDYHYGMFADPLYFGRYPDSVLKHSPPGLGKISPRLASELKGSMDLFSFNAYTTRYVKASPGSNNPEGLGLANYETLESSATGVPLGPVADSSWLIVTPWGFRKALKYLNDRYHPGEMAVTENGVSVPQEDNLPFPAVLKDTFRVQFYDSYLKAAAAAVKEDGVPLKTYFAWSLLDNFECELEKERERKMEMGWRWRGGFAGAAVLPAASGAVFRGSPASHICLLCLARVRPAARQRWRTRERPCAPRATTASIFSHPLSPFPFYLSGADGFAKRFGITYVDYKDGQKRYPKDSFRYLSKLWGGSGGADLPEKYIPAGFVGSSAPPADTSNDPPAPQTP